MRSHELKAGWLADLPLGPTRHGDGAVEGDVLVRRGDERAPAVRAAADPSRRHLALTKGTIEYY